MVGDCIYDQLTSLKYFSDTNITSSYLNLDGRKPTGKWISRANFRPNYGVWARPPEHLIPGHCAARQAYKARADESDVVVVKQDPEISINVTYRAYRAGTAERDGVFRLVCGLGMITAELLN